MCHFNMMIVHFRIEIDKYYVHICFFDSLQMRMVFGGFNLSWYKPEDVGLLLLLSP